MYVLLASCRLAGLFASAISCIKIRSAPHVFKSKILHKIESIVSFLDLHDEIPIKKVNQKYNEVRFTTDMRNESLGKKIREATAMKIPVQLIVGPKDQAAREVSVRTQDGERSVALDMLGGYLESL